MAGNKIRHLFPGNNTSKGFYSFYKYILPQKTANRILCLKGGPGTGKSSFMKKVGEYFSNLGYSIEYHHCSSDNNSLDGVVISELNVAILDGTSPHIVDPVHPGAVDEIINLGVAFNRESLTSHKDKIISITSQISQYFTRAYMYFASAKSVHDDWSLLNKEALSYNKVMHLIDELKSQILSSEHTSYGDERHMFSTALTPDGIVSFNEDLAKDCNTLYVLKGGPGLMKTNILKELGSEAQKQGLYVEYFHDPLIPERIENIIIPQLETGIFTTNEISRLTYNGIQYNMKDYCNSDVVLSNSNEILYDKRQFDSLINKGLSCISISHTLHDKLEEYYISSMNFDAVNEIYDKTIKLISDAYIN